jgi:hypothetical protein
MLSGAEADRDKKEGRGMIHRPGPQAVSHPFNCRKIGHCAHHPGSITSEPMLAHAIVQKILVFTAAPGHVSVKLRGQRL